MVVATVRGHTVVVVVVERMCRRTSAGIAVPATTPIKISRPDVNYRLESFAPKERETEKKGLKITLE